MQLKITAAWDNGMVHAITTAVLNVFAWGFRTEKQQAAIDILVKNSLLCQKFDQKNAFHLARGLPKDAKHYANWHFLNAYF